MAAGLPATGRTAGDGRRAGHRAPPARQTPHGRTNQGRLIPVGNRRRSVGRLVEHPSGRGLVAIPLALIIVITVVDVRSPADVHLGPLLVIAPTLTASLAGPLPTALVGVLAVAAQVVIAVLHGGLTTTNHVAQILALILLTALVVLVCHVRERRARELERARSVAETAQRVLLRPPRTGSARCARPGSTSRPRTTPTSAATCSP